MLELVRPGSGMAPAETLAVTFDGLLPKTLEQLKILNGAIFPIRYKARRRPSPPSRLQPPVAGKPGVGIKTIWETCVCGPVPPPSAKLELHQVGAFSAAESFPSTGWLRPLPSRPPR